MEFLALLLLVSNSLLLPSLGLAVSGQEAHGVARLHERPSPAGARVSVAQAELAMVASSVLGAESWLRAHVLARYPSNHITAIAVGRGVSCGGYGQEQLRVARAAKNLHHALVRWGLVGDIKIDASSASCVEEGGALKRRLYGMHHLPPPSVTSPPPPGVPLSFAPNSPPEVVPSVPPAGAAPPSTPVVAPAPASPPPMAMPATPPDAAGGMAPSVMPAPCLAAPPAVAAMSPPPLSGEGGNGGGGLWCVAKPTVPLDRLQEAMDYACSQDGVDCQEVSAGGSCFYPDTIAAHASYAFNSYWQKMKRIGGSCGFGGAAVLINSDPSYLQCRFMLS
ncbi:translation initiation factor IF-2 [Oryza brachyantha]|uniref:translation initiation factor IF-2 n=1 Tax=Oryza brachyantha TaxID=4533 RepID=UPI001ADBFD46|nr:translation initiation factor IF-2 [Oryza brachyantha]XP_040384322.1 translation initiation factor IF-2 [Oryza brachyantha]